MGREYTKPSLQPQGWISIIWSQHQMNCWRVSILALIPLPLLFDLKGLIVCSWSINEFVELLCSKPVGMNFLLPEGMEDKSLSLFSWLQFNCWCRGFCLVFNEQHQNLRILYFLKKTPKKPGESVKCKKGMGRRGKHTSITFLVTEMYLLTQWINFNKAKVSVQPWPVPQ